MATAVTEYRTWSVNCRAELVIECHGHCNVTPPDATSTATAEAAFRDRGWKLHSDGTATCPVCRSVFAGETALRIRGSINIDPYGDDVADGAYFVVVDRLANPAGPPDKPVDLDLVAEEIPAGSRVDESLAIFTDDDDQTPEDDS